MLEMLPTPWGLVRSGVAPDHPKIKSISAQFEKTALDPPVPVLRKHRRWRPRSEHRAGRPLRRGDLCRRRAVRPPAEHPRRGPARQRGRRRLRRLAHAHPHFQQMAPDLSTGRAVVVGNGNVALDVARILVTDPDVLATTDIADHALKVAARPRCRGGTRHRQARAAAGAIHHAGASRAGAISRASATSTWSSIPPISQTSPTRT